MNSPEPRVFLKHQQIIKQVPASEKGMVWKMVPFLLRDGQFSGAVLVSGRVEFIL